jgi:predicted DNA-binding protein (MmcQ/YjbR family)
MNKRHWVSIILDGSMTEEQVFQLIAESYTLTQPDEALR